MYHGRWFVASVNELKTKKRNIGVIHLLPRRRLSGLGFLKDPPALPLMCLRVTVRPDAALLAEILGESSGSEK